MGNDHERFRASLPGYLFELLPEPDQAWSQAHAATCHECAQVLERIRTRLPELQDEAGHVPVSVLEDYALGTGPLTPLESELVRRHLRECVACRNDAREMAEAAGIARISPMRAPVRMPPRLAWGAGLVAAAALVVVFALRFNSLISPSRPAGLPAPPAGPASEPVATTSPPPAEQSRATSELVVLRETLRGSGREAAVKLTAPIGGSGIRLRVPRLFVSEGERVLVRIVRADGLMLWADTIGARALEKELVPKTPDAGWTPGSYRLEIVPGAGADTLARRVFDFSLVPH